MENSINRVLSHKKKEKKRDTSQNPKNPKISFFSPGLQPPAPWAQLQPHHFPTCSHLTRLSSNADQLSPFPLFKPPAAPLLHQSCSQTSRQQPLPNFFCHFPFPLLLPTKTTVCLPTLQSSQPTSNRSSFPSRDSTLVPTISLLNPHCQIHSTEPTPAALSTLFSLLRQPATISSPTQQPRRPAPWLSSTNLPASTAVQPKEEAKQEKKPGRIDLRPEEK